MDRAWVAGPVADLAPPRSARAPAGIAAGAGADSGAGSGAGAAMVPRQPAGRPGGLAAFDPGRPGLRALAMVAAVVAVGAALLVWLSRPQPEPVVGQLAATAPAPAAPHAAPPTPPAELVVAVVGAVRRPGLVQLPPGARVADAIEAAGGLLSDAELAYLNLARRVTDGELIAVGTPPPPGAAPGAPGGEAGVSVPGQKLNLNTASLAELQSLSGVGPVLAQRIVAYRDQHGGFSSVSQLRNVSGIGDARYAELKDLVTVW